MSIFSDEVVSFTQKCTKTVETARNQGIVLDMSAKEARVMAARVLSNGRLERLIREEASKGNFSMLVKSSPPLALTEEEILLLSMKGYSVTQKGDDIIVDWSRDYYQ